MHERLTMGQKMSVYFTVWTLVFKVQGSRKSELHWIAPNWHWILNSQRYFIYARYLPQTLKFSAVLHNDWLFTWYKVVKNRKCTGHHQTEREHLRVKSFLYTLSIYLGGPNFSPFCLMASGFQDERSPKIGNTPNNPNWTWTLNSQIYCLYTKHLPLRPKFWSISLYD